MSQAPAASIFAEVNLRRERAIADYKAMVAEMRAEGQKLSSAPVQVQVTFKIDPQAQAKLNAAVAKITVSPIVIPVTFAPGPMPGGVPGGVGLPFGASSPNFSMMLAQQAQQIVQGLAPTSSPNWSYLMGGRGGPGAAPGGAGGGNLYNPLSPRGLSRFMGSGLAAYGALSAVHLATGLIEADQIASHPERVLRQWDHVGALHDVNTDPIMRGQAQTIAKVEGEKKVLETFSSVPLVGVLVKFVDAVTGATKALEDQEHAANHLVSIHQYSQAQNDATDETFAKLTYDPVTVRRLQRKKDETEDKNVLNAAQRDYDSAMAAQKQRRVGSEYSDAELGDEQEVVVTRKVLEEKKAASGRNKRKNDALDAEIVREERARQASSNSSVSVSGVREQASRDEVAGNPLDAMLHRNRAEFEELDQSFQARLTKASPAERARIKAERDAAVLALNAKQGLGAARLTRDQALSGRGLTAEGQVLDAALGGDPDKAARIALATRQDRRYTELQGKDAAEAERYKSEVMPKEQKELEGRQHREREKETGDSEARIVDIEKAAGEKSLRARGQVYAATAAALKRSIDDRVGQLEREAKAETDVQRKREKLTEAAAVRRAGAQEVRDMDEAHLRQTGNDRHDAMAELGTTELEAGGQTRDARDKRLLDRYDADRRRIYEQYGENPPTRALEVARNNELTAARARYSGGRAMADREDFHSDRSLGIATADASAHAQGQHNVGQVLDLAAHVDDLMQDAGDDPMRQRRVQAFAKAKVAEFRRNLKPQAGKVFDLVGYHDALQSSITSGASNEEALKLLDAIGKGAGPNGRKPGQAGPGGAGAPPLIDQAARDMGDASKNLNAAAQIIKNAKQIAVIGRR